VSPTNWRSRIHGLVADPDGLVLLLPSERGWMLPCVEVEGYAENDLRPATRALGELLGAPVTILRYADRASDTTRHSLEVVYVLECPGLDETPPGAEWAGPETLVGFTLAELRHREILDRHLREVEQRAVPAQRVPWAREGWLAEASDWIEESLASHGRPPTGRIEQFRAWCLSCLLRVPTADGAVFFKATVDSPLFVDEGAVMGGLARLFPENVPMPLAVDAQRRWMLLDDFGPELDWNAPLDVREEVLRLFAGMQVESSRHSSELLALGCVDRRLGWLAPQIRDLLADDASLAGLEDGEVTTLRALGPKIDAMCAGLDESGVPDALVHGDLHLSNVARLDGRYVFYDWTDAGVTHPFFDLIDVFREQDDAVRERLRHAYLSVWLDYEPMDRLLELWRDAEPLALLHHAVSYRHILANVEPGAGQELEWALPFFLRKVLAVEAIAP